MKNLISVVIPVYNVEKYLKRCAESILQQTYTNIEIILVNDGSRDSSSQICEEYKAKDSRIRVIHKQNGGLSDARNAGIDIACGAYITFVDSDDYVSKDYLEFLYHILITSDSDISVCKHKKFTNEQDIRENSRKPKDIRFFSGEEAAIDLCYQKHISNSACGKLYKMKIFDNQRYPVGKLYEDLGTTYKLLLLCDKVGVSEEEKYYYFQRSDSIMHYDFSIRNMDRVDLSEKLHKDVKNISFELEQAAICRLFVSCIQVLRELPFDSVQYETERNRVKDFIYKYRKSVLTNKQAKPINRIISLSTYLGLKNVQKLGLIYQKTMGKK